MVSLLSLIVVPAVGLSRPIDKNRLRAELLAPTLKRPPIRQVSANNGLSDYLKAVEIFQSKPNRVLIGNLVMRGETQNGFLSLTRKIEREYGDILPHIARGNSKTVFLPQTDPSFAFSTFKQFEYLVQTLSAIVYLKLAEGNSQRAREILIDGLIFADKISVGSVTTTLLSIQVARALFSTVEHTRFAFSQRDSDAIAKLVSQLLQFPVSVMSGLEADHEDLVELVQVIGKDETGMKSFLEHWLLELDREGESIHPFAIEISNMDLKEIRMILNEVLLRSKQRLEKYRKRLTLPESEWLTRIENAEPKNEVEWIENLLWSHEQGFIEAVQVFRTQLRILRLTMSISSFCWENRRIPVSLHELKQEEWIIDPLHGEQFQYVVLGPKSYRLYSKGTKARGEIDLVWRLSTSGLPHDSRKESPPLLKR